MTRPTRFLTAAILIVLAIGVLAALYIVFDKCMKTVVSQEDLLGTWSANFGKSADLIVLKKDFKYEHSYTLPNGTKIVDKDSWELEDPSTDPKVNLHHFALFRPDRTSYSCDDSWSIPVEPWLNKRRLIVDKNEKLYFEK